MMMVQMTVNLVFITVKNVLLILLLVVQNVMEPIDKLLLKIVPVLAIILIKVLKKIV